MKICWNQKLNSMEFITKCRSLFHRIWFQQLKAVDNICNIDVHDNSDTDSEEQDIKFHKDNKKNI